MYKFGDFGCAIRVKSIVVGSRREAKARAKVKVNVKMNVNVLEFEWMYEFVGKILGMFVFIVFECCEGELCDGFKVDVWAFGMTFYALATGRYFY